MPIPGKERSKGLDMDVKEYDLAKMTADIVCAHLSSNRLEAHMVPQLMREVHATLREMTGAAHMESAPAAVARAMDIAPETQASAPAAPVEEGRTEEPLAPGAPEQEEQAREVPEQGAPALESLAPEAQASGGADSAKGKSKGSKPKAAAAPAEAGADEEVRKDDLPADVRAQADQEAKEEGAALLKAGKKAAKAAKPQTKQAPAVPIEESVHPDYIVCLEDGKHLKMLKRYLTSTCKMSLEEYKAKWGLPDDYPTIAPNYRAEKSAYASIVGLGKHARKKNEENAERTAA